MKRKPQLKQDKIGMSGKYEVEINLSSKKRLNGRKKEREQMREKKKR